MATFRPTQANLARISRRTGGVDKLTSVYKQQVADLTGEYTKSFSEYQSRVSEQLAPFEAAMKQYQEIDNPKYQTALSDYSAKMEAYRAQLEAYSANPYETVKPTYNNKVLTRRDGQVYQGDFFVNGMQINDYLASVGSPTRVTMGQYREEGLNYGQDFKYLRRAPEKLTEQAPVAPELPVQPEVSAFDSSQFEQKRGELESGFKREVGERRAARLQATRRSNRTMLGGR